jgi:hypothetical protein
MQSCILFNSNADSFELSFCHISSNDGIHTQTRTHKPSESAPILWARMNTVYTNANGKAESTATECAHSEGKENRIKSSPSRCEVI